MRKICVVTGTRAEYGLLYGIMKEIDADPDLELQLVVTGMHLSPEFGLTYREIEQDGFAISRKVEMVMSSDTPVGIAKSIALGIMGMAEVFDQLKPDLLVLLGDRYETFAAAQAALAARIPIAHIGGGDTTEGAMDEALRHSITKMAHLHFVTHETSAARVRQLGENPDHIFVVGSPGLDQIKRLPLLSRPELGERLNFTWKPKNLLITFHPVTLEPDASAYQFQELLAALTRLGEEVGLIFTMPNSDTEGRILIRMIQEYVENHTHAKAFTSFGQLLYLSTMAQVDAIVGNSSSALYEAPSLKTPAVNIGDRQKGRLLPTSVIQCQPVASDIVQAIQRAFQMDCSPVINPYGDGNSSKRIVAKLKEITNPRGMLKKTFYPYWERRGIENENN